MPQTKSQIKGYLCAFKNCKSAQMLKQPYVSFFRFPKDPERCAKWVEGCNRPDLFNKNFETLYKYYRVCGKHFKNIMFLNDLKNRLQPSAYPSDFQNETLTKKVDVFSPTSSQTLIIPNLQEINQEQGNNMHSTESNDDNLYIFNGDNVMISTSSSLSLIDPLGIKQEPEECMEVPESNREDLYSFNSHFIKCEPENISKSNEFSQVLIEGSKNEVNSTSPELTDWQIKEENSSISENNIDPLEGIDHFQTEYPYKIKIEQEEITQQEITMNTCETSPDTQKPKIETEVSENGFSIKIIPLKSRYSACSEFVMIKKEDFDKLHGKFKQVQEETDALKKQGGKQISDLFVLQKKLRYTKNKIKTLEKKIKTNQNLQILREMFNEDQVNAIVTKTVPKEWSRETIERAEKLKLACGETGYEELRRINIPLPDLESLEQALHKFKTTSSNSTNISMRFNGNTKEFLKLEPEEVEIDK